MLSFRNSLPNLKSKIRVLNAATGKDSYDIDINNASLVTHLPYGNVTDYIEVSPGEVFVDIYISDNKHSNPILKEKIELLPNTSYTVLLLSVEDKLLLIPIIDPLPKHKSDLSNLRFINLTKDSPLLSLHLKDGSNIFDGVEYLESSSYFSLEPKTYTMYLTSKKYPSYRGRISDITLEPNKSYTLYSLGLMNNKPKFGYLLIEDRT